MLAVTRMAVSTPISAEINSSSSCSSISSSKRRLGSKGLSPRLKIRPKKPFARPADRVADATIFSSGVFSSAVLSSAVLSSAVFSSAAATGSDSACPAFAGSGVDIASGAGCAVSDTDGDAALSTRSTARASEPWGDSPTGRSAAIGLSTGKGCSGSELSGWSSSGRSLTDKSACAPATGAGASSTIASKPASSFDDDLNNRSLSFLKNAIRASADLYISLMRIGKR